MMIDLVVGDAESVTLRVHHSIAIKSSRFLQRALTGNWKEAEERTVRFPDLETEVFRVYLHWAYTNTISTSDDNNGDSDEYLLLAKLYVLGERLLDKAFQEAAIMAFVENADCYGANDKKHLPGEGTISFIWEHTISSSTIRDVVLDMFVDHGRTWDGSETIPKRFLQDYLTRLLARECFGPANRHACEHHNCMFHAYSATKSNAHVDDIRAGSGRFASPG